MNIAGLHKFGYEIVLCAFIFACKQALGVWKVIMEGDHDSYYVLKHVAIHTIKGKNYSIIFSQITPHP